jgi:hypothetical protein
MEGGELADEMEQLKLELAEVTMKWKDERVVRQKLQSELSSVQNCCRVMTSLPGSHSTSSKISNRGFGSPSTSSKDLNLELVATQLNALRQELANSKKENFELERKARVFEIKAINKSASSDEVVIRVKRIHELKIKELEAEVDAATILSEEADEKIRWLEDELADKEMELSMERDSTEAATQALLDMELKIDLAQAKSTKVRPRLDACLCRQHAHTANCGSMTGPIV